MEQLTIHQNKTEMPWAPDMERAVLGAIILEPESFSLVEGKLTRSHFHHPGHVAIMDAIQSIRKQGGKIDLLGVCEQLRHEGTLQEAGGPYYITQLTNAVNQSGNIEYHTAILTRYHIRREMASGAVEIMRRAMDINADPYELPAMAQHLANHAGTGATEPKAIASIASSIADKIERGVVDAGYTHGLPAIDALGKYQRGELVIEAGRPGMGKTAKLVASALANAKQGIPVMIWSGEMSEEQVTLRMVAAEGEVNTARLSSGELRQEDKARAYDSLGKLSNLPIHIDDSGSLTVEQIRGKVATMVARHGVEIVFIDYIGLITPSEYRGNPNMELEHISRQLKLMAKDLNIAVVALHQLSRAVEEKPDKRPELRHLRNSGALEQDAYMVLFLYRPEYYGLTVEDEFGVPMPPTYAEAIVAKNRNGKTGTAPINFIGEYTKYVD